MTENLCARTFSHNCNQSTDLQAGQKNQET